MVDFTVDNGNYIWLLAVIRLPAAAKVVSV